MLANAKVPTGRAASGREWMIAQAADVLGHLKSVGENQAVFKALVRIVSEPKFSLATRGIAADSLGRLNYADTEKTNTVEATAALGQLAIDACEAEIKNAPSASADETEDPEPYRRLVQRLCSVSAALKGLAPLAQEEAPKTFLDDLLNNTEQLQKSLESTQSEGKDMTPAIKELQGKLTEWLGKKPA